MLIWDSESENDQPTPIEEDRFYRSLGEDNGVLIVDSCETSDSRTTVLLFVGPNSKENWTKWNEFARLIRLIADEEVVTEWPDEELDLDDISKCLKKCFDPPTQPSCACT